MIKSRWVGGGLRIEWGVGVGCKSDLPRGTRKCVGVVSMFIISIVVMVSQMYTCVKTYQVVHLNMCSIVGQLHLHKSVKNKS